MITFYCKLSGICGTFHIYMLLPTILLMLACLLSAGVSAFDPNTNGFPSCTKAAPRPMVDVSTCSTISLFLSY